MRKLSSVLFAVFILFTSLFSPLAAVPNDTIVTPLYDYIISASSILEIDENTGISSCIASCYSLAGYTVEVECSLQQYIASNWTTIKSWSSTGSRYAGISKNWAVYSGYTYRVYSVFRIYDSAGNLRESEIATDTYVYPSKN